MPSPRCLQFPFCRVLSARLAVFSPMWNSGRCWWAILYTVLWGGTRLLTMRYIPVTISCMPASTVVVPRIIQRARSSKALQPAQGRTLEMQTNDRGCKILHLESTNTPRYAQSRPRMLITREIQTSQTEMESWCGFCTLCSNKAYITHVGMWSVSDHDLFAMFVAGWRSHRSKNVFTPLPCLFSEISCGLH